MSRAAFDYKVKDQENNVMVDVTLDEPNDDEIQIGIRAIEHLFPFFSFFMRREQAVEFAHAILAAVAGDDPSQIEHRVAMSLMRS